MLRAKKNPTGEVSSAAVWGRLAHEIRVDGLAGRRCGRWDEAMRHEGARQRETGKERKSVCDCSTTVQVRQCCPSRTQSGVGPRVYIHGAAPRWPPPLSITTDRCPRGVRAAP